jgi:hypothetical protein
MHIEHPDYARDGKQPAGSPVQHCKNAMEIYPSAPQDAKDGTHLRQETLKWLTRNS